MASHKDSGRDRNAGRKARERRRQILPSMDHLEDRRLMAVPGSLPPTWVPTSTDLNDAHNGPLAKAGTDLVHVYHDYSTALAGAGTTAAGGWTIKPSATIAACASSGARGCTLPSGEI